MRTYLALLTLCAAAGLAHADDDYPLELIDRPMALPDGAFQPFASFQLLYFPNATSPAPKTVKATQLAFDTVVAPKVQVGAYTQIEVGPETQFLTGLASVQYKLLSFIAARVDAGVQRVDNGDIYGAVGIGLPTRFKISDKIAIISSRPYAWGAEDDLVQIRFGGSTISDFHLPLGVMFQLSPNYNFALRSGYRHQGGADYAPAGADFTASFSRLDLGVTVDLAGQVGPANGTGYFDIVTSRIWAQLRI